jgi:hypothetical protein
MIGFFTEVFLVSAGSSSQVRSPAAALSRVSNLPRRMQCRCRWSNENTTGRLHKSLNNKHCFEAE